MMKKAAVLSLATLAVVGCGPTETEVQEAQTTETEKKTADNQPERVETLHEGESFSPGYELIIIKIDGHDMECVLMERNTSSSSTAGLSCNWDAIND